MWPTQFDVSSVILRKKKLLRQSASLLKLKRRLKTSLQSNVKQIGKYTSFEMTSLDLPLVIS